MKTQLQTGDRQPNLILSSANDKLMERIETLKNRAISAKKQQVQKKYQELLGVLAKGWFLVDDLSSLPPKELQALEFLVCKTAKRRSRVFRRLIWSIFSLFMILSAIILIILNNPLIIFSVGLVAIVLMLVIRLSYEEENFGANVPQFLAIKKELERKPK